MMLERVLMTYEDAVLLLGRRRERPRRFDFRASWSRLTSHVVDGEKPIAAVGDTALSPTRREGVVRRQSDLSRCLRVARALGNSRVAPERLRYAPDIRSLRFMATNPELLANRGSRVR